MITRDSAVWTLAIIGAAFAYLIGAEKPPTQWTYPEWLQAGSFIVATISGYLRTSPLKGEHD